MACILLLIVSFLEIVTSPVHVAEIVLCSESFRVIVTTPTPELVNVFLIFFTNARNTHTPIADIVRRYLVRTQGAGVATEIFTPPSTPVWYVATQDTVAPSAHATCTKLDRYHTWIVSHA